MPIRLLIHAIGDAFSIRRRGAAALLGIGAVAAATPLLLGFVAAPSDQALSDYTVAPSSAHLTASHALAAPRPLALASRIREGHSSRLSTAAVEVLNALNTVREEHGLAPATATSVGHSLVRASALTGTDPALLPVSSAIPSEYGIWGKVGGTGVSVPIAVKSIVNTWVYNDGWMGSATRNINCTAVGSPGCNAHREAILSAPPRQGAQLYIDAAVVKSWHSGIPSFSISAQVIWVAP